MLARTSVRTLVAMALVALLALTVGLLSQRTASAQPVPDETVPTNAVVGTDIPPNIECKWELPDMDSNVSGIQYTTSPGHVHDDDMAVVPDADNTPGNGIQIPCDLQRDTSGNPIDVAQMPGDVAHMIQVTPNLENLPEERRIQLWTAVDDPTGIDNIIDVFWDIYHPDGTHKTQVHASAAYNGGRVSWHEGNCASLGTGTSPDGSMFEAAAHTGQLSAAAVDDGTYGMIVKCQEHEKALYYSEFQLSKDQPCGQYQVVETLTANGGTDTLTNYIDILCVYALQIDFNTVDWGDITPGITDTVSGDLIWNDPPDNAPTVKNVGNDGMGLQIHFSEMTGPNKGKIDTFDGCFGRSAATILCLDPIPASTWADFGQAPAQVLCANEVGKLDLSIHPPTPLVPDTYTGTMDVLGYHVPGECKGNVHID
jgi:hypothetical protein